MKLYNYQTFNESKGENIHEICEEYDIKNYTINQDGSIDVDDSVFLFSRKLNSLPLKFKKITGSFYCNFNKLSSLEGCPEYVSGYFNCCDNKLLSLEGSPSYVGGSFNCSFNKLTSLVGCPNIITGDILCEFNKIRDFEGFPEDYEGDGFFDNNPVNLILKPIPNSKKSKFIYLLNEYGVIRNGLRRDSKKIIKDRFEAAYEGIGMELPENIKIEGYEII